MIPALVAILLPWTLGYLVLMMMLRPRDLCGAVERISMAFPLGMGLVTLQMFALGLMRVRLNLYSAALPVVAETAILYFWVRARATSAASPPAPSGASGPSGPLNLGRIKTAIIWLLSLWIIAKLGSVFLETCLRPIFAWDSFANWSASAKLFYYSGGLLLDDPAANFFGSGIMHRNANYPPHNPLMQVWMALWMGNFDEILVKLWSPVYLLCAVLYLFALGSKEIGRLPTLAILTIFLGSPFMCYHATETYGDVSLGVYVLLAMGCFLQALRGREVFAPVAGLFCAETMFAKDEGLFFALPLLISACVFILLNPSSFASRRRVLAVFFLSLTPALPWFVFKVFGGLGFGAYDVTPAFTFRPEMVLRAFQNWISLRNFDVLIVFLPFLIMFGGRPSRELLYLALQLACYVCFFLMLYSFTKYFSQDICFCTAIFRNTLTFYPASCLLAVLSLRKLTDGMSAS